MDIVYSFGIVLASVFVIFGTTFDPGGTEGLMVGPLNLDTLINFVDPASILIVLGGMLAVVVACYLKLAKFFPKHFKIMLRLDTFGPEQYMEKLTELAQIARENDLLASEEKAKEQEDPFFQQAIMFIVNANDPDRVRSILENDIEQTSERHQEVIAMHERGSNVALTFGMIGTLIGLINMLKNLSDSDVETPGPSMPVALVTTFHGSLLAHAAFNPTVLNLTAWDEEEILCRQIIMEGTMATQSGENPKFLRECLVTSMNQKLREGRESGGSTGEKKERKCRKEKQAAACLREAVLTMKKKKSGGGGANWMDTYGDMVTLLLCFFVMLYSTSTLDKEKWIALVQSFNPIEEVTETQPPSASGSEGTGTQESIDQNTEELYQAMQDYVQQAGMANQVTLSEGNGYVFISFDDIVFFSGDSYELRDEGKVVLDEVSQIISEVSSSIDETRVLGHTAQAVPGRVNNVTADRFLASNRVTVVTIHPQEKDMIDPARLVSVDYGEQRPVSSGGTSTRRAENWRVELTVIGLGLDGETRDNITQYYTTWGSTGTSVNP